MSGLDPCGSISICLMARIHCPFILIASGTLESRYSAALSVMETNTSATVEVGHLALVEIEIKHGEPLVAIWKRGGSFICS